MKERPEQGFTIIEAMIVLIVSGILLGTTISVYQKYMNISRRQQGVILVERELNSIQLSFEKALTTMPGRELGHYGDEFTIPGLPALESKDGPIVLGLVTPFKIGGNDAVTVVYGRREYGRRNGPCIPGEPCAEELARMELAETSRDVLGQGIARVAIPGVTKPEDLPFKAGDLMLLVGLPPTAGKGAQSVARLVRLNGPAKKAKGGKPVRDLLEFNYNFCESGSCGTQFPQLRNRIIERIFRTGSALVPLNVVTFYLAQERGRRVVARNDGGEIVEREDDSGFEIAGGNDSLLGEADSITIKYLLKDDTIKETPARPVVDWLNQIKAVEVELSKSVKLPFGNEVASRTLNVNYPIKIRTIE